MSQALRNGRAALCGAAILGATLAGGTAGFAADEHLNVQPGNWEVSLAMEMPGMPSRPPIVTTHCSKPEQVKDAHSFADMMQERNRGKCKVSDVKLERDKLSYSFACENGGSGSTELAFAGTSYEGTTKITVAGHGAAPMTMTQHIRAKRLGDC
jgi:Protein of unknown function (DUF3617)